MSIISMSANSTKEVVFFVQMQFKKKGLNSTKALRNLYQQADIDQNGKLVREELESLLNKAGIFLSRQDVNIIFNYFDVNKDQAVSFEELYNALVPPLNEKRLQLANQIYSNFGKEPVTINEIFQSFYAENHPEVRAGRKTAQEINDKFLDSFDAFNQGGELQITRADFIKNVTELSACIPHDDDYFIKVFCCTFGLQNYRDPNQQTLDLQKIRERLRDKIKFKLKPYETEEMALLKAFKYIDSDQNGVLEYGEFHAALERLGFSLTEQDKVELFNIYDKNGNGLIDYSEFVKEIFTQNDYIYKRSFAKTLF